MTVMVAVNTYREAERLREEDDGLICAVGEGTRVTSDDRGENS
jgi:hypothetical protein